jgi:hypothetical protein
MLKISQKKHAICTLMTVLLLSVAAASLVQARAEDVASPPAVAEESQPLGDTPNLVMTMEGNVTVTDNQNDEPNLYQTQDNPPAIDKNSTLIIAQDDTEGSSQEENSLTATQTSPDFTVPIVGIAVLLGVAAVIVALLFVRKRTAN